VTIDTPEQAVSLPVPLTEQVAQLEATVDYLEESISELTVDDRGWQQLSSGISMDLSTSSRPKLVETCRALAKAHPLLKRGLNIRIGYVWGQGVEVTARVPGDSDRSALQDQVNQCIDAFEVLNEGTFTGMNARDELERALGTDGEVFLSLFTNPAAGEVRVRTIPTLQIKTIVTNPDDAADPWFYVREWDEPQMPKQGEPLENPKTEKKRQIYPALGFEPRAAGLGFRPRVLNGMDVMWDAPMVHLPVNRLAGEQRGVPDVYASLAWARLYRDFLVDWSQLTHSLSLIAFKATGETKSRATLAASKLQAAAAARSEGTELPLPRSQQAGGTIAAYGVNLEAVSKSGATIDSESGKPLAAMVASGLGVPVTLLLADPGVTGARAVAETLDLPTMLEMGMRRLQWQSVMSQVFQHVIAAKGMLGGSQLRGLTGEKTPVLDFTWPPLDRVDPVLLVGAIVQADSTEKVPPPTTARLLLGALGVKDVDEVLAPYLDAQGNWKPPVDNTVADAGQAAVNRQRAGQDPADGYNG
jgi:hypothetical protein